MVRRSDGGIIASLLVGIALGSGCGSSSTPQVPDYEIHDASKFAKESLNAPLSPEARAKGAQVPPPPTR